MRSGREIDLQFPEKPHLHPHRLVRNNVFSDHTTDKHFYSLFVMKQYLHFYVNVPVINHILYRSGHTVVKVRLQCEIWMEEEGMGDEMFW